jgi:hypothetical protein
MVITRLFAKRPSVSGTNDFASQKRGEKSKTKAKAMAKSKRMTMMVFSI